MMKTEDLQLTAEWDKVFPRDERVDHCKVTFANRYGITLAADLYKPKGAAGKLAAIAVSGPFGACKEQSSGLYAQEMAARGFLTMAFDPSFTGESGGQPRFVASPDINTEDFMAAVDYLSCRDDVDPERVGIIGICGWGGMAVNAAALDPRIKATAAMTMYDMSRVAREGYFGSGSKLRFWTVLDGKPVLHSQREYAGQSGEVSREVYLSDRDSGGGAASGSSGDSGHGGTVKVREAGLRSNVRTGPGLSYDTLGELSGGMELEFLNETSIDDRGVTWYKVRFEGRDGWVSEKYTKLRTR
jgi:hypothetical protein